MDTDWINTLPLDLQMIEEHDYIPPNIELGESDHVIGEIPEDLKKLYTLWRSTDKSADELSMKIKYGEAPASEENSNEFRKLKARSDVLSAMFWHSVQIHLDRWDVSAIGVRTGWRIIEAPIPGPQIFRINM